ncbi:MAG: HlyD family secretion protein [Gammaproteobacteria bacterium]
MADNEEKSQPRPWVRRLRIALMILGPVALIVGGLWYYLSHKGYESTDDAYVQANTVTISPQIPGRVAAVPVHENQRVAKGDVLLRLDSAPYEAAYEAAQARLTAAGAQVRALEAQYQAFTAQIAGAQSEVAYLGREVKRQGPLARKNVITNAKLDAVNTQLEQAQHKVTALQAQRDQLLARLGGNPEQPVNENPDYKAAAAALAKAKLDLSYTVVRAPAQGIAGSVTVRPGDVLSAGSPALPLVETAVFWIKANFKETQLTHMHPGQPVTVSVDAYPGKTWKAHVASISPGSGESFALLPPQNATGNWVKVVQRIPVRIALDPGQSGPELSVGMSAEVTVYVGGHKNHQQGQ